MCEVWYFILSMESENKPTCPIGQYEFFHIDVPVIVIVHWPNTNCTDMIAICHSVSGNKELAENSF